ncbi:TPA: hypothetical protein LR347_004724 [Enterobacter hormaechei]|nr:hypothetical protein [Enterobacter hormaechei]
MFFTLRKLSSIPLLGFIFSFLYRFYNVIYGASIPLNVCIPKTTRLPHGIHGVFISKGAVIGENVTIFHQVTIGSNQIENHKMYGAPIIGDGCFIGTGTKIIGKVKIGRNVRFGTNVSVATDIPDNCSIVTASFRKFS